jgi:elongation factor P
MITPNQFKKGLKVEINDEPFSIIDYQHTKKGRGGATVTARLKSLVTGNVLEMTFKSDEKIEIPDFEEKKMQYLYKDGSHYYFMDNESYEQVIIDQDVLGEDIKYLVENAVTTVQVYKGEVVGVLLPNFIEVEISETNPGFKGDTVTGSTKPAKIISGATVYVPLFINEGDVIKIDTRSGEYIERVKSV